MEDKNQNLASCSKPPSPVSSVAEREEPNNSAINQECERALTAFRQGNHAESLQLVEEACKRHGKHALFHRFKATIFVEIAGIVDDQTAKQWYMKNGIESAQKACVLSPNSIEFAHFYANLLYEAAQEYGKVVQECERALQIENPTDPANDSFLGEQQIPTAEGLQKELQSLIQKANNASISTWMRNFGNQNAEENLRFIPIRKDQEGDQDG